MTPIRVYLTFFSQGNPFCKTIKLDRQQLNGTQFQTLVSYKGTIKVYICPRTMIEVNQLCPKCYCTGDNVDVVVIREHALVTRFEVKGRVLLVV